METNGEGLKRRGFSAEAIRAIKNAYKVLYLSGQKLDAAIDTIASASEGVPELQELVSFLRNTSRSIVR